jgi:hypothetical protein
MLTKRQAIKVGRARGLALASWVFDGNTTDATYRRFLELSEEGSPKLYDEFGPRSGWLSGEMAGESINEILGRGGRRARRKPS